VLINIVKHLSVQLIDAFQVLSTAWHCFLGVDRQVDEPAELGSRRKKWMQESASGLVVLLKEKSV
jgi:hypothetical protein